MSEPAAKPRQLINLDEFERRLARPAPSTRGGEDPLAELARLVGNSEDRFGNIFQAHPSAPSARDAESNASAPRQTPRGVPDWLEQPSRPQPVRGAEPQAQPPRVDFAAIEAGLRGSLPPEFADFAEPEEPEAPVEDDHWLDAPYAPHEPAQLHDEPRSRMPLYVTAAIIAAGILGIGGTFALKRTPPAPHQLALIKAGMAPVKVRAPQVETASASAGGASLLEKTPQPAPTKIVSHAEQPLDVNAVAGTSANASTSAQAASGQATAPASSVPVPPPPGSNAGQGASLADMMQPRKVKTIAVRPDGTFETSGAASGNGVAGVAAPGVSAPSGPAAPVGTITPPMMASAYSGPSGAASAPSAEDRASMPPRQDARRDMRRDETASQKPQEIARAETGAEEADHGGRDFSVQLAAPATQAQARAELVHLQRAYGAELRGYHLRFHQAKVGHRSVFRVRVGGLTHDSAISLCEKLKAKGGSCFIARE